MDIWKRLHITLDQITHHRLNQVISVASEFADCLVDVDLALLLELLDERVDGDEGAGSADAGGAVDRDGSVLPRLVDAFDESEKLRKLWLAVLKYPYCIGYKNQNVPTSASPEHVLEH